MLSVQFKQFGSPDVLKIVELSMSAISEDELLIKTKAAGVNPIDTKIRQGSSFVCKTLQLPSGMGFDVAGEVVECGKKVKSFKVGDRVFGSIGRYNHPSSYAEYCVAKPTELALIPENVDFSQAAALPIAAVTAWQALHEHANIQQGQKVLIHAAAGGVGHVAVQLAKLAGAYVIATASPKHRDFLNQLNVNEIIDYTKQPFEKAVKNVDVVIDLVGGEVGIKSLEVLKPAGFLVTVPSITRDQVLQAAQAKNIKAGGMLANISSEILSQLINLVASGKIKLNVSHQFLLQDAAKAHRMIEEKKTQGKIVLICRS